MRYSRNPNVITGDGGTAANTSSGLYKVKVPLKPGPGAYGQPRVVSINDILGDWRPGFDFSPLGSNCAPFGTDPLFPTTTTTTATATCPPAPEEEDA